MLLGVDFDNTIVCYDALFHRVAVERGLIPASVPVNKTDVRDHLRRIGREDEWTELQGVVYGPRIGDAEPYPGVREFFQAARVAGIATRIISHKTRAPFRGEAHDLHAAALDWLEQKQLLDTSVTELTRTDVHLELTKAAKLERIASCGCTHFVDDLPEFLAEPGFPAGVTRILFDPNGLHRDETRFARVGSWTGIRELLIGGNRPSSDATPSQRRFVEAHGFTSAARFDPLAGGANNRVFKITDDARIAVLKAYFTDAADPRDRFSAERAFYAVAWNAAAPRTPEPFAWDAKSCLGLFSFIPGRKLESAEVDSAAIGQAMDFVAALNLSRDAHAESPGSGSEACFDARAHLTCVERRLDRLAAATADADSDAGFCALVLGDLGEVWKTIRGRFAASVESACALDEPLPASARCLSPSDFGFHNALLDADGRLRFFDFEYAGWDDPAKLVCDFFCQPQRPVPAELWDEVVHRIEAISGDRTLAVRARRLWPVYQVKWCCILLNEFVRDAAARRSFASGAAVSDASRAAQLGKARAALDRALELSRCQS